MGKKIPEEDRAEAFRRFSKSRDWSVIRWMLMLRPALVTATLGVAILLIPTGMMDKFPIAVILLGTYVLTILYWIGHRFSVIQRPLLAVQIAFDIFIITVIIHYTGGIDSSFVGFYFLSVMCASLFFRRLVTFIFATLAVYFYVLYMFFLGPHLAPTFAYEVQSYSLTMQVVMYSMLIYFVAFFSSIYSERIFKRDKDLFSALKLLKEARLDTSDIIQSLTNGLITVNMRGIIVYLNRAAEKILDLDRSMAEGWSYSEALGERNAELSSLIEKNLINIKKEPQFERELTVFSRDGVEIPLGTSIVPLYDVDRSRRGIILNFVDLTEKKKLIEMVRQADRMAAIGELSAAIAHEIRNPLASITNAVEVLKDGFDEDETSSNSRLLCVIEKESDRLERICSDFLKFARVKNPEITEFNLGKKIGDILLLLGNDPRKKDKISIFNEVEQVYNIRFDEDQFEQLIINILINSFDAIQGEGEIKISIEKNSRRYGRFVRLIVTDTGPGFPKEAMGHMFEPFFSTKKGGTGLGLALVRKIVIGNKGRILAGNGKKGGAEIALDIPLAGVD